MESSGGAEKESEESEGAEYGESWAVAMTRNECGGGGVGKGLHKLS